MARGQYISPFSSSREQRFPHFQSTPCACDGLELEQRFREISSKRNPLLTNGFKKMQYVYTMEFYTAIKKNKILLFVGK
jgi:hypothetical protein